MDEKECARSTFPYMPSGTRFESSADKHTSKKRRPRVSGDKKCQGDIVYVQNPLFNNVALRFKDRFEENCKVFPINFSQNIVEDNHSRKVLPSDRKNFLESQGSSKSQKSRKDRMKARAENRRDVLFNESSDEDYSSVNSSNDLRSNNSRQNSSNMEDAYNRRSRAARTERYFRRLSREDGFCENDFSAAKIGAPKRIQDVKFRVGNREPQPVSYSGRNNLGERGSNLMFFHQDETVLNNPIYNTSRGASPMFYNKRCQNETIDNQAHGANITYNKSRRSDPGSDVIFAYKNTKSPRALDRVQYFEPKIYDRQQTQQIEQQNKPAIDPNRHVKRSYSFQSELPKEYESRNNAPFTMRRTPMTQAHKLGNENSRSERKWIDSIVSSTSSTANLSSGDLQRRKLYLPKGSGEVKVSDKDLTPTFDSDSTNLFAEVAEDKMPVKKRSSKDLGKELSELEKMYTSLRLSDDNLLERAEERCVEEFNLKGQSQALTNESSKHISGSSSSESIAEDCLAQGEKYSQQSSEAHVINDDMAYRKMQTKKMPALSETQNSLSQISYLLASSALILDKTEYPEVERKVAKEEPNITKDDVVYRNLHYANKVLKVMEPQPPFGIPLRPATPSTNSNYLCSSPVAIKSPPLKFVPQSEPNLITDDLAFRNLRKDAPKTPSVVSKDNKNEQVDVLSLRNDFDESLNDEKFFKKKRKAVRSLSANLYGLINEVKNLDLKFE